MTLPETLTLVRHGESEANVFQKKLKEYTKQDLVLEMPEGFLDRHDSNVRLTAQGVTQAESAGDWLNESGIMFDRFYVSPHTRTCETAAHLRLDGEWRLEDRIRERDWGEAQTGIPLSEVVSKNRSLNAWYWKPPAGESLATGVRLRVENIMNSLYRKTNTQHTIMVTHGEFIRTAQFVIERMNPAEWLERDEDLAYKVQNTIILQYSRVNPNDSTDVFSHFKWRRAICPWDESLSWDNGEWVQFSSSKLSDAELLAVVEQHPRLL